MPLRAEIEQQETLERNQIKGGLEKLKKDTLHLEKKEYASATVYGSASIATLLPTFVEYLDKRKEERKLTAVKGAGHLIGLLPYLFALDTESQAVIAAKLTFDKVFSPRRKNQLVVRVTESIGSAIEAECQMQYYEKIAPPLFAALKETYWHQAKGTEYKRKSMQTIMNKHNIVPWKAWSREWKVKLGGFLLNCLARSSGWFESVEKKIGNKSDAYVITTDEFNKHKEEIVRITELFSPLTKPMLIEPRDWTNLHDGGYYLNQLTNCHEMVRRGVQLRIQGKTTYDFLNQIQKVKYRLSDFIVGVAKELEEREIEVGKFRPVINHPIPPKPADFDTNKDSKKQWKKDAAIAHNKNANEWRISCRTRMTMNCVREFEDTDFYIPWSFDYRGRAYPIPSFLTPQDTDFGKSLLRFSEESEITEDGVKWLAFQVATTYGLDKATMDERLAWVSIEENKQIIIRVARDPINNIGDWENADEPWQFLVACHEYYSVVIAGKKTTGLPVATDATCSGLQILAGLARDKSTARLVNVIPSNKPQDAYQVIADHSRPHIPERLRPYWDRKKTKRCVMTIPYNAKPFSNRQYIRDAFKDIDIEVEKEELTQIVQAVRNAMEVVVPGPMKVMRWIEQEVSKAIRNGAKELMWVTPSGFRVTQKLMKQDWKRIQLQLFGTTNLKVSIPNKELGVDLAHHKNATAPNLIHSLDASLLHLSATRFDAPISLIHDSVLCRATDMTYLSTLVRDTYMHLFAEHDFLKDFAQAIGAETEPPIIGDLQPSEVIESTYFFC
jgi:DNA-directed RNA polymerase